MDIMAITDIITGLLNPKTKISKSGILQGFTDWHCHILPGVDDGFQTVEDSLEILRMYEEAGIANVWFTPHIMEDMPNKTADLKALFESFSAQYYADCEQRQGKRITLHLAAENMMDSLFDDRLAAGDLLPLLGDKLLVETSYFNPPMDLFGILQKIKSQGFFPILAHPERYMYMNDSHYQKIKDMGVTFQLNLASLYGGYGGDVKGKAYKLLKKGYYSMVATDLHRVATFERILDAKIEDKYLSTIKDFIR